MKPKGRKHVHIIGIAGVTMAPLAVLHKELGWKVTGSDRAFFPPMSTYLRDHHIKIMPGYKATHLMPRPDLVLVMAFITKKNPELAYAIHQKIPYKTYGEVLPSLIEQKHSIVVAGSRGKTTVTALAAWLLEVAGYNPNFMIGGLANNFTDGLRKTTSSWSVIEGDEYPIAQWRKTSRFLAYAPRYLILTGATWDHMDVFPTKVAYRKTFERLVQNVPKNGFIVANAQGEELVAILKKAKAPIRWYDADEPTTFTPPYKGRAWQENTAAVIALGQELGINDKIIQKSLDTFKGIKRRQEVRHAHKNIVIIDDNAHSPEKVAGALETIAVQYPNACIVAIYEPGNRNEIALRQSHYAQCFARAKYILLPRVSAASEDARAFNEKLAKKFSRYYTHMRYIPDDKRLVSNIQKIAADYTRRGNLVTIVFMSQKGFRGMIDETIEVLKREA